MIFKMKKFYHIIFVFILLFLIFSGWLFKFYVFIQEKIFPHQLWLIKSVLFSFLIVFISFYLLWTIPAIYKDIKSKKFKKGN